MIIFFIYTATPCVNERLFSVFFQKLTHYIIFPAVFNSFFYSIFQISQFFPKSMSFSCKETVFIEFFTTAGNSFIPAFIDIYNLYFQIQKQAIFEIGVINMSAEDAERSRGIYWVLISQGRKGRKGIKRRLSAEDTERSGFKRI